MSPWEACNTVPNTSKQAALRIEEFFRGVPENLKGIRFLNIDQLQAASQANGFKPESCEDVCRSDTSPGRIRMLRMKWSKGDIFVVSMEDSASGNIPILTIIDAWGIEVRNDDTGQ
jgi:hypothetical protein